MTASTDGMSRPREATSVATNIFRVLDLNLLSEDKRVDCESCPCKGIAPDITELAKLDTSAICHRFHSLRPRARRSMETRVAFETVRTKIIMVCEARGGLLRR